MLVMYWNPVGSDGGLVSSELYNAMNRRLVSDENEPVKAHRRLEHGIIGLSMSLSASL